MIVRAESADPGTVTVRVRAKVNVALAVLGRRPDGYHGIDTVMLPISLEDRLTVRRAEPGRLTLSVKGGPPGLAAGPDNTIMRAARALQEWSGREAGAAVALTKRIPVGAGLGGGSADAAAALAALNRLWRCGVSRAGLREIAASIGSDVPFFLGEGAARARGRGEKLSPVACRCRFSLVLVYPGFESSTREVYGAWDCIPLRARSPVPMAGILRALRAGDAATLAARLFNDLEAPAARVNPRLRALREKLNGFPFLGVGMSGSGSCYFGICRDGAEARALARRTASARLGRVWAIEAG